VKARINWEELMNTTLRFLPVYIVALLLQTVTLTAEENSDILNALRLELDRSLENLTHAAEVPLYYLAYQVTEEREFVLSAQDGGFKAPQLKLHRYLDVDVRVGDMQLDNTREIRGGSWRDNYSGRRIVEFPLESDPDAIRSVLWAETEYQYRKAQERYTKVLANRQVKVEEENLSDDFSPCDPHQYVEETSYTAVDTAYWNGIIGRTSAYFTQFPFVFKSSASMRLLDKTIFFINSDGSRLQHSLYYIVLGIRTEGMAEDGMELKRDESWAAASMDRLPDEETIMKSAERLVKELEILIDAPIVDPYIGPAILRSRASGVFFHEIFGHRIEAQSQKSVRDGQTFTKKIGEQILPEFISIYDDPTLKSLHGKDLRGYYKYDDEGTPSERVTVVENGILKNFLTSRSPLLEFKRSNGHGRRNYGYDVISRQGNLIVESTNVVPFDQLKQMLVEECKRQNKPYGLIFEDISGGFTMTGRWAPQAFKVLPLYVVRVYADGSPDEAVRGVDIVGTPLTSFSKILITGDEDDVFNGSCGAASGMVPVTAVSPSILVSEIEVQKRPKGQEKPPILPPPGHME